MEKDELYHKKEELCIMLLCQDLAQIKMRGSAS